MEQSFMLAGVETGVFMLEVVERMANNSIVKLNTPSYEPLTLSMTFAEVFETLHEKNPTWPPLETVQVLNSAPKPHPQWHNINPTIPVMVAPSISIGRHVRFVTSRFGPSQRDVPQVTVNAFSVLMSPSPPFVVPLKTTALDRELNAKEILHNDIVHYCRKNSFTFPGTSSELAMHLTDKLVELFWNLRPYLSELTDRSCVSVALPNELQAFFSQRSQGFGEDSAAEEKRSHKRKPQLTQAITTESLRVIEHLLGRSFMARTKFTRLAQNLECLQRCVISRLDYLKKTVDRMKVSRGRLVDPQAIDGGILTVIESLEHLDDLDERYIFVNNELESAQIYHAVSLNKFLPMAIWTSPLSPAILAQRKRWKQELQLRCAVELLEFDLLNAGHLLWAWQIPAAKDDRDINRTLSLTRSLQTLVPKYTSISQKKAAQEMIDSIMLASPYSKTARNLLYQFLTGDSRQSGSLELEREERLEAVIASGDSGLVWDLRDRNGRSPNVRFERFFKVLNMWIDEVAVAQERREIDSVSASGTQTRVFLPFAASCREILEEVTNRLFDLHSVKSVDELEALGFDVPSESLLSLQFMPQRPSALSSWRFTGRLALTRQPQQRLLRVQTADCHYANCALMYGKQMAMHFKMYSTFVSADDKHRIAIGEPGNPLDGGARAPRKAIVISSTDLVCADHDHHAASVVPSGYLIIDIPQQEEDNGILSHSWVQGQLCFFLKDAALQPSSPERHAAELVQLLQHHGENTQDRPQPILFLVSDAGPDRNLTHFSVILRHLLVFIQLDLDFFLVMRPAAHNSAVNPIERSFSVCNLGLSNCAFQRSTATRDEDEVLFKKFGGLHDIRAACKENEALGERWLKTLSEPMSIIRSNLERLTWTDRNIMVLEPASRAAIDELWSLMSTVDSSLKPSDLSKATVLESKFVVEILESHCRLDCYTVQFIKKVGCVCLLCLSGLLLPPRLPDSLFQTLHFCPHPMPSACALDSGMHYMAFHDLYDTNMKTTEEHRPSLAEAARKSTLGDLGVAQHARCTVICIECKLPRVVYAASVLDSLSSTISAELRALRFTCGQPLLPETHPLFKTVRINENLACETAVEMSYFSSQKPKIKAWYRDICGNCGSATALDMHLINTSLDSEGVEVAKARDMYATLAPQCGKCKCDGKERVHGNKKSKALRLRKNQVEKREIAAAERRLPPSSFSNAGPAPKAPCVEVDTLTTSTPFVAMDFAKESTNEPVTILDCEDGCLCTAHETEVELERIPLIRMKMLTDTTITWAQEKLSLLFPVGGLQSTLLWKGQFVRIRDEDTIAVQIVHSPPLHWVWLARVEDEVFFGDSLQQDPNGRVQQALRDLFARPDSTSPLEYSKVRMQTQNDDISCGVFCIASAYLVASGEVPPRLMSSVDFGREKTLWDWLCACWLANNLTRPPVKVRPFGKARIPDLKTGQCPFVSKEPTAPRRRKREKPT